MSKIAMIGAGKTGRGFIGRLLAEDNKEILFIDKNESLVKSLNDASEFKVSFFGGVREPMTVENYKAVTWDEANLSDVEIIFVSVGGTNLPDVGAELKKLINDGKTRHIIVGENASHPAKTLSDAIDLDNITVSESTVFCTTIEDGELDAFVEKKYESFKSELGQKIRSGKSTLAELAAYAEKMGTCPAPDSGRQEYLESVVNKILF